MNTLKSLLFALFIFTALSGGATNKERPVDLANPLIDTHKPRYDYFISATLPYGMVALSPDTQHGDLWNSGYRYDDRHILNFSHVHNAQTAGIPIMPVTGACKGNRGLEASQSKFSHERETVRPGYHKVFLEDYKITAELTATCRVGMHRYTFPETGEAHILFDLTAALGPTKMSYAYVKRTGDREIEGYSVNAPTTRRKKPFTVYFVARFDTPFDDFSGWKDNQLLEDKVTAIEGENCGAYVTYKNLKAGDRVQVKVAISYVGTGQARKNMEAELPHWNFERTAGDAEAAWNDYLGRISVEGGTREQRIKLL